MWVGGGLSKQYSPTKKQHLWTKNTQQRMDPRQHATPVISRAESRSRRHEMRATHSARKNIPLQRKRKDLLQRINGLSDPILPKKPSSSKKLRDMAQHTIARKFDAFAQWMPFDDRVRIPEAAQRPERVQNNRREARASWDNALTSDPLHYGRMYLLCSQF